LAPAGPGAPEARVAPYLASITVWVFALVGEIVLISANIDPLKAYAPLSGGFGDALVLLLLVATIAIMESMRRTRPEDTTV